MFKQYYRYRNTDYGRVERTALTFWPNLGRNLWRFFSRHDGRNFVFAIMLALVAVVLYAAAVGRLT